MTYKNLCISRNTLIRDAIKKLEENGKKILLVIDFNKLDGVITDGDIRRWILKKGNMEETVVKIMNTNPICLTYSNKNMAIKVMQEKCIHAIPLINENKEVVDIVFWNEKLKDNLSIKSTVDLPVVIMAGGKGTRLYPYTKIIPKPLIPIGDIPIIERIINKFTDYGCRTFYLTVNYKKNMIKAYFNEAEKDYEVLYVEEEKPLGTGGSLYMLKNILKDTFFLSNCDIIVDANYSDIIRYHKENNNKITVITSLKDYQIPYGIIKLGDNGSIDTIIEKPQYSFLVNTGMYVLEPDILNDIPENEFFHITQLIERYIKDGKNVGTYPVTDNAWLDMGEIKEMERMIERLGL